MRLCFYPLLLLFSLSSPHLSPPPSLSACLSFPFSIFPLLCRFSLHFCPSPCVTVTGPLANTIADVSISVTIEEVCASYCPLFPIPGCPWMISFKMVHLKTQPLSRFCSVFLSTQMELVFSLIDFS